VFVTNRGRPWLSNGLAFPIVAAAGALMRYVGVDRRGLGFYALRHVFRTKADESLDRVAVDPIMGHSDGSMGPSNASESTTPDSGPSRTTFATD
jgi:hypothetical protein